jgi:hypothetical protein
MAPFVVLRAFIVWLGILVFAILNGAGREVILVPALGTEIAFVLSGALLSLFVIVIAYISLPWLGPARPIGLLSVGLGWAALTIIFEFSLGLWQGHSWSFMLAAYKFEHGNIWPIVLVVVASAPYVAAKLRRRV